MKFHVVYRLDDRGSIKYQYGWTKNKTVCEVFMTQRNSKKKRVKYICTKIRIDDDEDAESIHEEVSFAKDLEIKALKIKSCKSGDMVTLFMTQDELSKAESHIRDMFRTAQLFFPDDAEGIMNGGMNFMRLFKNLKKKFGSSLTTIGYDPIVASGIYDSLDDPHRPYPADLYGYSNNDYVRWSEGSYTSDELEPAIVYYTSMIYSLESLIKVMTDEFTV